MHIHILNEVMPAMIEKLAKLYAEKALNDNLLAQGMISPEMHRRVSESIILDIDICSQKVCW